MRLDDVVFRIKDTRIYVEFETGEIIREYVAKEEDFASVQKVCLARSLSEHKLAQAETHLEACYHSRGRASLDARSKQAVTASPDCRQVPRKYYRRVRLY